jgi:RimJ/RimL family protein N-acetyltransferase
MTVPLVETERLFLRSFSMEDLGDLVDILSKPEVTRYLAGDGTPSRQHVERLLERIKAHWDQWGYGWWAVCLKDAPKVIGWCGLGYLEESGETEVLYMLDTPFWGKGIATEAARASLRYGFEKTDLQRIIALSFPENIASQRVMQKCGLRYEKEAPYFGYSLVCYQILKEEYQPGEFPYRLAGQYSS